MHTHTPLYGYSWQFHLPEPKMDFKRNWNLHGSKVTFMINASYDSLKKFHLNISETFWVIDNMPKIMIIIWLLPWNSLNAEKGYFGGFLLFTLKLFLHIFTGIVPFSKYTWNDEIDWTYALFARLRSNSMSGAWNLKLKFLLSLNSIKSFVFNSITSSGLRRIPFIHVELLSPAWDEKYKKKK